MSNVQCGISAVRIVERLHRLQQELLILRTSIGDSHRMLPMQHIFRIDKHLHLRPMRCRVPDVPAIQHIHLSVVPSRQLPQLQVGQMHGLLPWLFQMPVR